MRFLLILPALFSLLFLACATDKPEGEEGAMGEKKNDTSASSSVSGLFPGYEVIEVTDGGTIRGRVTVSGEKPTLPGFEITANEDICAGAAENNRLETGPDGGVAWAVVRLVDVKRGKGMPSPQGLTVDQVGCRYTPHVLAAPVGSRVTFLNSDPTAHNVRVEDTTEKILMNVAQPQQGDRNTFDVTEVGPYSVGCDYHPWMNAYVFGVGNPYYAVTGPDGAFALTDIPPGEYELRLWLNGLKPVPKRDNRGVLVRYRFEAPYEAVRNVKVGSGEEAEENFTIQVSE